MIVVGIDPIYEAHLWLQTTLEAAAGVVTAFGTRIHMHPAPRDETYPQLTHDCISDRQSTKMNIALVGGETYAWDLDFLVTGYVDGQDTLKMHLLKDGTKAVYEALHLQSGLTANAEVIACYQTRPFSGQELTNNVLYLRHGGEYRVQIRPRP